MFFDLRRIDSNYDKACKTYWFHDQVKGFVVPDRLIAQRETVIVDLKEAITTHTMVDRVWTDHSGTIDFVGEQWDDLYN